MRILLDENAPAQTLEALRWLLPAHEVRHVGEIRWTGKKDHTLLLDAARKGFEAFLTKDGRQLEDPEETTAIKKSGLHHVRFTQGHGGMTGLGLAMGAVIAAMPLIVRELEQTQGQRLVHIKGLNPGSRHRFELVNPSTSPPRYWPR